LDAIFTFLDLPAKANVCNLCPIVVQEKEGQTPDDVHSNAVSSANEERRMISQTYDRRCIMSGRTSFRFRSAISISLPISQHLHSYGTQAEL